MLADFFPNDGIDTVLCLGEVLFTNQSLNADIYNWDFGDGNTSMENSPSNDYSTPGRSLVLTAAHCLLNEDPNDESFVSNYLFIPKQDDVSEPVNNIRLYYRLSIASIFRSLHLLGRF